MGKLFNINKILNGNTDDVSELEEFERDIVSLDETGPIGLSDDDFQPEDYRAEDDPENDFRDEDYSEEDYQVDDDLQDVPGHAVYDEPEYYEPTGITGEIKLPEDEYREGDHADSGYEENEYPEDEQSDAGYEENEYPEEEYADSGYEENEYPEDDDPALGFDEVRLDTASINAEELSKFINSGRHFRQETRRALREKRDEEKALSDHTDQALAAGIYAAEDTDEGDLASETSERGIESAEYVNLDESHEQVIEDSGSKRSILKYAIIAVACVALIVAGIFAIKSKTASSRVSPVRITDAGIPVADELLGVGSELSDINTIGGAGLNAAIDQRIAEAAGQPSVSPDGPGEPDSGYDEHDLIVNTRVAIELITVKADLKIRFINSETGKLIPNIPFSVTITDPSGKTSGWTDDDLDGIIYKTSLSEGRYKIHIEPLSGDKYEGYSWPSDDSITVKSTIDYAQVDVESEVKDASQVNENAEDTASRGNTSQQDLSNTVEFLESASKPVYTEIAKDTIKDPLTALLIDIPDGIVFASDVSGNNDKNETPTVSLGLSQDSMSLKAGGTGTFTVSYSLTVASSCTLSVESSDTTVAKASITDKTVTVTAVAGGSATIKVTAVTDKTGTLTETATAVATCSVTVSDVDMTTVLKDNSGNEVYVLENGEYRKATFADYAKFDKFYIITGTMYNGWQTIDGSTYYYNAEGKPVTGTQVIQGVTYMFAADGKMTSTSGVLGIDVSKWNGNIDWAAVKASGVEYVIIRVGYRGSTAGALIDDSRFVANINGAKGAGLKVGVYFVTQAVDDVEAVYEASMVIDRISGYSLDLPVFIDVEPSGGRGDRIDKAARTSVIVAFCETIRSAGYAAGIYANKTWLETKMDTSQFGNYKIWVAHYSSVCGYTGRYDMWQYTDKGTISGVSGSVDLNLRYT